MARILGRQPKKSDSLSVILREKGENAPRKCITSIGINPYFYKKEINQVRIFASCRDRFVYEWDCNMRFEDLSQKVVTLFDEHTDWVTNLQVIRRHHKLVTCSNDMTVKIWNISRKEEHSKVLPVTNRSLLSISRHSDYITCMGVDKQDKVFTGSLDGHILCYDLNADEVDDLFSYPAHQMETMKSTIQPDNFVHPVYKSPGAVAINDISTNIHGTLIAVASANRAVIMDPRGRDSIALTGHEDLVKKVVLNLEGNLCLSGSADQTIKLWDIRMRRSTITYTLHDDSVWAIQPFHHFSKFISGGRDGKIFLTNIIKNKSCLLYEGESPIQAIKMGPSKTDLWFSEMGQTGINNINFKNWVHKMRQDPEKGAEMRKQTENLAEILDMGKSAEQIQVETAQMVSRENHFYARGLPSIRKYEWLSNRRYILTLNTDNVIQIWDALLGIVRKEFKDGDFDETYKEFLALDRSSNVSWCTADIRLGSLSLHFKEKDIYKVDSNPINKIEEFLLGKDLDRAVHSREEIVSKENVNKEAMEEGKIDNSPQTTKSKKTTGSTGGSPNKASGGDQKGGSAQTNFGMYVMEQIFSEWMNEKYNLEADELARCGFPKKHFELIKKHQTALREKHHLPVYKNCFAYITSSISNKAILGEYAQDIVPFGKKEIIIPPWVVGKIYHSTLSPEIYKMGFDIQPHSAITQSQLKTSFKLSGASDLKFEKLAVHVVKGLKLKDKLQESYQDSFYATSLVEFFVDSQVLHIYNIKTYLANPSKRNIRNGNEVSLEEK